MIILIIILNNMNLFLPSVNCICRAISQAKKSYLAIEQHAPDKPTGYLKLAQFYVSQRKPDQAIDILKKGLPINPDWIVSIIYL